MESLPNPTDLEQGIEIIVQEICTISCSSLGGIIDKALENRNMSPDICFAVVCSRFGNGCNAKIFSDTLSNQKLLEEKEGAKAKGASPFCIGEFIRHS